MKVVLPLCMMALVFCLSTPVSAIIITSTTTDPFFSSLSAGGSVSYVHTGVDFPETNDVLALTLSFSGGGNVDLRVYDTTGGEIKWKALNSGATIDLFELIVNGDLQGGQVKSALNLSLADFPAENYSLLIKNKDKRNAIDISSAMTFDPPAPAAVPEPSSLLLFATGAMGLSYIRKARSRS